MKYPALILLFGITVLTGCTKTTCIQCTVKMPLPYENTPIATVDSFVYVHYCGRQADTALSSNPNMSAAFVQEHNIVPYTCFYTN